MDGGGRELRSVAGLGRTENAAIPGGYAHPGALRRGALGRTIRRVSRGLHAASERVSKLNGTLWSLGILAGAIGYGMAVGGQSKIFLETVTTAFGFGVERIEIRGIAESDSTEIVDRIDVAANGSLLMLDAEKARGRIAEIPWVTDVAVRKQYPSTLIVSLKERKPYALWQDDGRIKVVDESGAVMADVIDERHAHLPLVVGAGANTRAEEAIALITASPALRPKLRAAVLVAERRWNIVTTDGVEIRLPEDNAREALLKVAVLEKSKRLLERDIEAVDLRAPDRLFIKLTDEAASARRDLIKQRLQKMKGAAT